jgi:hypothetical protein
MGRRKNEQAFASRDMHLDGGSMILKHLHASLVGQPGHF